MCFVTRRPGFEFPASSPTSLGTVGTLPLFWGHQFPPLLSGHNGSALSWDVVRVELLQSGEALIPWWPKGGVKACWRLPVAHGGAPAGAGLGVQQVRELSP